MRVGDRQPLVSHRLDQFLDLALICMPCCSVHGAWNATRCAAIERDRAADRVPFGGDHLHRIARERRDASARARIRGSSASRCP